MAESKKKHVLLAEDEAISMLYLRSVLQNKNFTVDIVATGENALRSITENDTDIILLDIQLAGEMNGIDTAKEIVKTRNIPVIFMTGYPNKEYAEEAQKLKPLAYIIKPIDVDEICQIIDSFFATAK